MAPPNPAPPNAAPRTLAGRDHPPSVDRILSNLASQGIEVPERSALVAIVRGVLAEERSRLAGGAAPADEGGLADAVIGRLRALEDPQLTVPPHVINATGVVLHTNLGRAPWPAAARLAAVTAGQGYGYLELDEPTGRRGARYR